MTTAIQPPRLPGATFEASRNATAKVVEFEAFRFFLKSRCIPALWWLRGVALPLSKCSCTLLTRRRGTPLPPSKARHSVKLEAPVILLLLECRAEPFFCC